MTTPREVLGGRARGKLQVPSKPPSELRRFIAGLRTVTAMLFGMALLAQQESSGWVAAVLLVYGGWCAWLVWREGRGRPTGSLLAHCWIDVSCITLLFAGTASGGLLALAFVQPVVIASVAHGQRQGVILSLFATTGVLLTVARSHFSSAETVESSLPGAQVLLLIGVFGLAPAAALLARPLTALRQRLVLSEQLEADIDTRRGLAAVTLALAERLRIETQARMVALVPSAQIAAPTALCTGDEASFLADEAVHQQLAVRLSQLPDKPMRFHAHRRLADLFVMPHTRFAHDAQVASALSQLSELLEVERLVVIPLVHFEQRRGHLIVGHRRGDAVEWSLESLVQLVPDLVRQLEQAALVDELNSEIASHERARIGRDLHDSAIQPYLGIKYAVESLALRTAADNPLAGAIGALADLVNGEISELRDTISTLRSGGTKGDNALIPAVRRQAHRFERLFGIRVQLDCSDNLPTSRALAGALFHLFNEALNNVRKHTQARAIVVTLGNSAEEVFLIVKDDAATQTGQVPAEFIPRSIDERVRELQGRWHVQRPNGLDTELHIIVPSA